MSKRKYDKVDYSEKFQIIINSISSSTLYMPEFYKFLYKKSHTISEEELDKHMNSVSIYNAFDDYKNDKNKSYICIYYNKGHWYSIVNNNKFDAYKCNIQIPGTNSFCQSFALYLAANNGNIENDFKKKKYIINIQRMAKLHYDFINTIDKLDYSTYNEDFLETFNEVNEIEGTNLNPSSINTLKSYFKELYDNYKIANEFAVSKEKYI
tara:strand:- start:34 stop:660 length:627 start_codon:yes stop_codon:yes gene_type:complete